MIATRREPRHFPSSKGLHRPWMQGNLAGNLQHPQIPFRLAPDLQQAAEVESGGRLRVQRGQPREQGQHASCKRCAPTRTGVSHSVSEGYD